MAVERERVASGDLYDYPRYYDLVFGSDWKAEFQFLLAVFGRYAGRPVRRVFEPACGTGRLLFRLGKAGYEVSGLDRNPRAIDYCNRRLERHGLPRSAWVGDMTAFRLAHRADAAFNMINSFRHLSSEAEAVAHLRAMHRALARGGVYVLGLHLTPTVGQPMDEEHWSARRGSLCVTTEMRTVARNLRRRQERFSLVYNVHTPRRHLRIANEVVFRTYTARQFDDLVRRAGGWSITATFDFAYDARRPIRVSGRSEDVVYVLERQAARR